MPPPHAFWPLHVTSHRDAPQTSGPLHAPCWLHVMLQREAEPHVTPPAHAFCPLQVTSHCMPGGHMIGCAQLPVVLHVNRHVVAVVHVPPANVHAAGQVGFGMPASTTTQYPPLHVRPGAQSPGTSHARSGDRLSTKQPATSTSTTSLMAAPARGSVA